MDQTPAFYAAKPSPIAIISLVLLLGTACGPEIYRRGQLGDVGGASGGGEGGTIGGGAGGSGAGGTTGGTGGSMDAAVDVQSTVHDCDPNLAPPETCGGAGCARLCIPHAAAGAGTIFGIAIPVTDTTGVSGVFRLCIAAGSGQDSFVQLFGAEQANNFTNQFDTYGVAAIAACPAFTNLTFVFDHSQWNYKQTQLIGVKLQSNSASAMPLVSYIDSITLGYNVSGGGPDAAPLPGPYTFDASATPFFINTYQPVADSKVGWVP
jgi:hypothetical protein